MKRLMTPGGFMIMALLFLPGCAAAGQPGNEIEVRPAPIHELKVSFTKSQPPQVELFMKVGLSDGCTTFNEAKVTGRTGNQVTVATTTKRPRNAMCTQVYGYFDHTMNLGSDFKTGETYTLKVNDQQTTFVAP